MNFNSEWYLFPQLQPELNNNELFDGSANQKQNISITLTTLSEIDANASSYAFSQKVYGEFKCGEFYYENENGNKVFTPLSLTPPKKLSLEKPGKAHAASHLGSQFSSRLLTFFKDNKKYSNNQPVYLALSPEIKNAIAGEEFEFLLGLLQKSVSNKVKKLNSYLNHSKTLIFNERDFSKESLTRAYALSNAMSMTRSLINMPPNELQPESFENLMRSLARQEFSQFNLPNNIEMKTIDYEQLLEEGYNLICAVGQGSRYKPRILKLVYTPKQSDPQTKHITLIGKGITFDSGGYDIKASSGMRNMKKDMGGAASAVGIFLSCASLSLPVKISCYLAIAENMVSAHAMRPGDIYKTKKGFHVEIENTDAEGRLVLADAMTLACDEKPDWLIDLATLTGAARTSLGPMVDSMFGNHPETNKILTSCSVENGDWIWEMPIVADYEAYLDSGIADFMNASTSSYAGSVTATLFLQKFISVEKWNHIDTFMWCDKANSLWQEGSSPTGKCVRLVTRAIEKFITREDNKLDNI